MSHDRIALTALTLLVAMVLSAVIGVRARLGAVVLALLALLWLIVDHFFEGRVLLTLDAHHGVTSADLVAVAAGLVAVLEFVLVSRRRP